MSLREQDLARQAKTNNTPLKSISLTPTDPHEVRSIVMGLRSHSAPGWDKITATILKQNILTLALPITYLCNKSLETGTFPANFKKAVVCPIFKSGEKSEPSNYRPISLLSTMSKILEKIVNKRLINYLEKNEMLSNCQFGFRAKKSTEDAVLTLASNIVTNIEKGDKCLGVFLDLQKAFDTVSTPILLTRLENVGIRGVALEWFTDYLTGRSQCVRVAGIESDGAVCRYGVPQGSTLGPTLFIIYVNELCNVATRSNMDIIMFADDTVLIFHEDSWDKVFHAAEQGLSKTTAWLEDSLLSLNGNKTKYLCFSKSVMSQPSAKHNLKIHMYPCNRGVNRSKCDCATLSRVASIKYLGITVDVQLTWGPHIAVVTTRIRKIIHIFKNLRNIGDVDLLLGTYRALCECIIRYCICVWGGAGKTYLLTAERAQRAVLKVLMYLPYRHPTTAVYEKAGVLSVRKMFIYEILRRYHKKIMSTLLVSNKRVERCPVPRTKSASGQRHFNFLGPYIYNKCNKIQKIKKLSHLKLKRVVHTWLSTMDYDTVENLLRVDK
ncbi:unnamed protein product [Arctia plantaginis]|uniref:Reverse transcriptase domain-containing protein n=1 Tax=Arctia plantaginis TaxID=874455 RepID=A0A8S0ZHM6_ARCPL|nr:unnamed protein product [Arctia plantaginis]CAB3232934.1 unnamed protein product [Arctia plantaginis]CAB3240166.1 unnamed protein product [Arctia plantaginis]